MGCDAAETPSNTKQKERSANLNPLQAGILEFDSRHGQPSLLDRSSIPKRYTLYSSLLLLPVNFATYSNSWASVYSQLSDQSQTQLFACLAEAFSSKGYRVTHIAINAPIAKEVLGQGDEHASINNVRRSPSELLPVWGEWGPSTLLESGQTQPTESDFDAAVWVSTKQVQKITQVWAPRWTMFSRGNLSEKERILGVGQFPTTFPGLDRISPNEANQMDVVDLYVGIGYFALCYLARGVNRVWGWDLNGWSIEGLRRGCEENGWTCEVVELQETGSLPQNKIKDLVEKILLADKDPHHEGIRCVAFRGDNSQAAAIMEQIRDEFLQQGTVSQAPCVRHVNLGLLPSSRQSWLNAVKVANKSSSSWLHVHENVEVSAIISRADEIVVEIKTLLEPDLRSEHEVSCAHFEEVKSYAPGVMHCVLDIELRPAQTMPTSAAS